jgi:trimethylamine-N-oxide reductase (cytochrome c)
MPFFPPQKQLIPKPLLHDAILDGHFDIYGSSDQMLPVEDQFKRYVYPIKGCSEIHMIWSDSPCWQTCWNRGSHFGEAIRSPKIEFYLVNHPWLENDCRFADIILPACSNFERNDIGEWGNSGGYSHEAIDTCSHRVIVYQQKCIEPLYECKSGVEIWSELGRRLGLGEYFELM